jgi:myo-inositol-1(or 4)-monophosphatase
MSEHSERPTDASATDSDSLLELARRTAHEATTLIRDLRPEGRVDVAATKSSPTDAVTEVDTAAERLIRERLAAARPDDGFVGEEGGRQSGTSGVNWVIDPIDGTVNFVYGLPAYAVSIGIEVDGAIRAGVVVDVPIGAEYTAVLGQGAWRCDDAGGATTRLQVANATDLAQSLVATGFGYDPAQRARQAAALGSMLPRVRDIRRIGSAALDLCSLAAGRFDAYVEEGLQPWDRAAGVLIAREAGAVVTGLESDEPDERLVVAAGPGIFDEFRKLVEECGF